MPRFQLTTRGMMKQVAGIAVLFAALATSNEAYLAAQKNARRAGCTSNLKQIALGIWNYQEETGAFPTGSVANPDLPPARRLGWNYLIAPHVRIRPPFGPGELTLAADDPSLAPLQAKPESVERCPSFLGKPSAHYAGIAGLGLDSPSLPRSDPRAGFFGNDRVVRPADVVDGTSNTMMVVESTKLSGPWYAGGRATVRGLDPDRPPYVGPGGQFGGIHPGGANVLMADGSITFVKDSIDPKVFEALSTIAGGEKVSAP